MNTGIYYPISRHPPFSNTFRNVTFSWYCSYTELLLQCCSMIIYTNNHTYQRPTSEVNQQVNY